MGYYLAFSRWKNPILLVVCIAGTMIFMAGGFCVPPAMSDPAMNDQEMNDSTRAQLLKHARELLTAENPDQNQLAITESKTSRSRSIVLSLGREKACARVATGSAATLAGALRMAASALKKIASTEEISAGRIKIDVELPRLQQPKPGASGRAAPDFSLEGVELPGNLLLLPEELSSRPLFKGAELQHGAITSYAQESRNIQPEKDPDKPKEYGRVKYDSFIEGSNRELVPLYRGNSAAPVDPDVLLRASTEAGDYLLRHLHDEGLFDYEYDPKNNQMIADYNEVRHAGTVYALLELYGATADNRYRKAAERAIEMMLRWRRPIDEADSEAIVYQGGKAKLGASALALVALLEYQKVTGDSKWLSDAKKLGRFLILQQHKDGHFESHYFFSKNNDDSFDSIYYPGEAVLALTRLQLADPENLEWQKAAERAADWLVNVRDQGKKTDDLPHDHWLLIALNELVPLTNNKKHLAHAEKIASAIVNAQRVASVYPDWIGSFYDPPRVTPTATRAEGLAAMWQLAGKTGIKRDAYLEALKKAAVFQMRCQLTPENILYLPRPDIARGGFRRSLTDWDVRIDYVQHNISSLLALREILKKN